MKPCILHVLALASLLAASMPAWSAHAGGNWSQRTGQFGHAVRPNGARVFHRTPRNLPDGVNIFSTRTRNLPDGVNIFHRHKAVSHPAMSKLHKRKHAEHDRVRRTHNLHSRDKVVKRRIAGNDIDGRAKKHHSRKRRGHHPETHIVYSSSVYASVPEPEHVYPEHAEEENCRYLTERGYDLSGRRVLVEWTLCFNEQGEAFVPADGRRVVARF